MTINQMAKIIKKMYYAFPSQYSKVDADNMIEVWYSLIGKLEYPKIDEITTELCLKSKFSPTISDIMEAYNAKNRPKKSDEQIAEKMGMSVEEYIRWRYQ